ncbi:Winged helix-turn-helix transcription repressor DNA-binding [Penicillium cf. griseofulvum]|uniref:Winged helix-turn-helix transcription repressor DNA-binding n=1 Tax=Penicillium cf. griseofulvum TaxID=2972120 RepID=A0A9W9MRQ2_9EURO|nr:Winged helix-turn-helix transcription repressor DNA-binding [Penicillium cf. griseofulvum]KAJ5440744.1 Winged helix-turn-helix transcription repressor DNA-binding [Penicillium cf. griseofulvum]KAJ5448790.1 Winged helix-turn-helix transcription repressor DNA-binding [Penicillium cf. griseofulvum]
MYGFGAASLRFQGGLPPGQDSYMNQYVPNPEITVQGQDNFLSQPTELSEPPAKRLRITHKAYEAASAPIALGILEHKDPKSQTFLSDGSQIVGSMERLYAGGSSTTPNESTTSTDLTSSFELKASTSPPPNLRQSLPTQSVVFGPNVLESGKVDLSKCRPRSSIPSKIHPSVYGGQCVRAAYASRLNPYALHRQEQEFLQDHLCHVHVTIYLNIRNGILLLWGRNPMVAVTREEALGCAKDYRWMNLASFAYDWLARNGYINHGCVEAPLAPVKPRRGRRKEGPTIVVIGAGMAGLGCARQLESLFRQYRDSNTLPRVIVLEGRRRVGGRIYSHPLHSLKSETLPDGLVPKAEMGAQIIVGFDHGNPLDQIVRGQLALHYHKIRDVSTIYDIDGSPVNEVQDAMAEKLYNDLLDRTGFYRHKAKIAPTAEGNREMIDAGRESVVDDGLTVRQYEEARAAGTIDLLVPTKRVRRGIKHKTAENEPSVDVASDLAGNSDDDPAALTCQTTGWTLNPGYTVSDTIELDQIAKASQAQTLGAVMDEGVKQYQNMLPVTTKDMRLMNWHFANLEYANATNVNRLSLSGWDQDIGNEFEGEHSQVIGGYQQLPYGLYMLPEKLDVRTGKIVTDICYDTTGSNKKQKAVIQCEDGEKFMADHVVFTGSLGVLKQQNIKFEPPLPDWKRGAIERLGFGIMNKVILVFEEPFWDTKRDMFGLLREPNNPASMVQEDYAANRGRFYLFWNVIKTTGLPCLIALMAGDAAHQAESTSDEEIITEVTGQLRNVFKHTTVPDPLETIITRWGQDPFTYGSYSYVAAAAFPDDYDLMARSIGNLHFAGEATCGTHPATVHGAYLSGLRAASEIIDPISGPIIMPHPLVPEKSKVTRSKSSTPNGPTTKKTRTRGSSSLSSTESPSITQSKPPSTSTSRKPTSTEKSRRDAYDQALWIKIYAELGSAPPRPAKSGLNPFLFYQKDYWARCRDQCDEARRAASNNPNAKAPRDEIRAALGQMWRSATPADKKPYLEQTEINRRANAEAWDKWKVDIAEWERKTYVVKDHWCTENPFDDWVMPDYLAESASSVPVLATAFTTAVPTVKSEK